MKARWFAAIASFAGAAAVISIVIGLSIGSAGGDDSDGARTPGPNDTIPPQVGGDTLDDYPSRPPTPLEPNVITIDGKELVLPDSVTISRGTQTDTDAGSFTVLSYAETSQGPFSTLSLDSNGHIFYSDVHPKHFAIFQDVIDAAGGLPTPSPSGVLINDEWVELPPGIRYLGPLSGGVWCLCYAESPELISRLYIDEWGAIVRSAVLPEHMDLYAPLIAVLEGDTG